MAYPTKNTPPTVKRASARLLSALALALATLIAVVALGASAARPSVTADSPSPGPVCFYQNGHPACVQRPGPNALTAPNTVRPGSRQAITPEALLTVLLAGPTPDERAHGITSALPPGARLVSLQTDAQAITIRLAFPDDYLNTPPADLALASDAIIDQIVNTLFPLGYRDFDILAQDPSAPHTFRPLSSYLPPITIPPKSPNPAPETVISNTQSPSAALRGLPYPVPNTQGSLAGKTIYLSAGHGWQWNGYAWRAQRPPYPDASTGYVGPIIEDHNNAEVVNQYLLRYLQNAGADVWTVRERDLGDFEEVVDDDSPGFVASEGWGEVEARSYQNRYLTATTSLTPTAAVTWTTAPLPADGHRALYVWYVPGADHANDAHYTVYHAGGSTELNVDQRHHGHTWRYVGHFAVRAGERLTVSLDNQSATPGQIVIADAVRFGGGHWSVACQCGHHYRRDGDRAAAGAKHGNGACSNSWRSCLGETIP